MSEREAETMTEEEARGLLPLHADGLLDAARARQLETVLEASPALQAEFKRLQEENALLAEALAPLRPSRSTRLKISESMMEAAEQMRHGAQRMADALPERWWLLFRASFAAVALFGSILLAPRVQDVNPGDLEKTLLRYIITGVFIVGILLVLFGRSLVSLETKFIGRITMDSPQALPGEADSLRRTPKSASLEALMLEVFGVMSVLLAWLLCYWR